MIEDDDEDEKSFSFRLEDRHQGTSSSNRTNIRPQVPPHHVILSDHSSAPLLSFFFFSTFSSALPHHPISYDSQSCGRGSFDPLLSGNHEAMLKKSNPFHCGRSPLLKPASSVSPLSSSHCVHGSRWYATAQGDLSWPSTTSFTPYDLFKQDRLAPYKKSHFYELVKVYHPDRPCNDHPLCRNISPEVRLQRYHIIVAAHEILSDPTKRAAYDLSGSGWNLHPPDSAPTPPWARPGRRGDGPIYGNATWEDWEAYHNRYQGKQENMVDHRTFATFVILLVLFSGSVQASWISNRSTGYEDRLRQVSEESGRLLNGRREITAKQPGSSEAKLQSFLIRRDPTGSGLKGDEQEVYQGVLHPPKRRNGPGPTDAARNLAEGPETA